MKSFHWKPTPQTPHISSRLYIFLPPTGANGQQNLLSGVDKVAVHMSICHSNPRHCSTISHPPWQANVSNNANCHKGVEVTISMVNWKKGDRKINGQYKQFISAPARSYNTKPCVKVLRDHQPNKKLLEYPIPPPPLCASRFQSPECPLDF